MNLSFQQIPLSVQTFLSSFCSFGCSHQMCVLALVCSSGKENRLAEKVLGNSHRHQLAAYKTWPVTLISRIDFTDYNTGKMSEFGADVIDIKLRPNTFHK